MHTCRSVASCASDQWGGTGAPAALLPLDVLPLMEKETLMFPGMMIHLMAPHGTHGEFGQFKHLKDQASVKSASHAIGLWSSSVWMHLHCPTLVSLFSLLLFRLPSTDSFLFFGTLNHLREYPSTSSFLMPCKLCHLWLGEDRMEGFLFASTLLSEQMSSCVMRGNKISKSPILFRFLPQ